MGGSRGMGMGNTPHDPLRDECAKCCEVCGAEDGMVSCISSKELKEGETSTIVVELDDERVKIFQDGRQSCQQERRTTKTLFESAVL
jgi:hypothetical protein